MSANVALSDTFDQWRVKTNELMAMTQTGGMSNFVKLTDTTNSTSNTTGSIITTGGVGVSKSMVIGENLRVHGDIHANGAISADGNLILGSDTTDSVDFQADIASHLIPNVDTTYDLGNTTFYWANAFINTVEIKQKSDANIPGLKITGLDPDAKCVEILSSQTTNDILYVNAASLTTGSAFVINQDLNNTGIRTLAKIIQDHTSAVNATGMSIQMDAGRGLFINTTLATGGYALEIDAAQAGSNTAKIASASTTGTILDIQAESITTGRGINYYDDSLTTGSALYIDSNSADTTGYLGGAGGTAGRSVAQIIQNHASATTSTALYVQNDSNVGLGLDVRGGIGTGGAAAGKIRLSTADTDIVDGDILGMIQFAAPKEGSGSDAILIAACIQAEADDTFAADNNATELVFKTAASEAATEKLRITSDGKLGINTAAPASLLDVRGTVQVGEDNTGHDVTFYGATASAYMRWDENVDDLILAGAAGLIVPDGQFTLGSTAVTSTAAELNVMDGSVTTQATVTLVAADGVVISDGDLMKQCLVSDIDTYMTSTTQTLTNKTLTAPILTTPQLGTPASGVMTNMTGAVTASIVDNAVTLAKMASGTDGNVISYDASGNPVAIATGTDGQVLTSTGAGSPPAFEDAAAGGAVVGEENIWTAQQTFNDLALTSGTSISWNANTAQVATLALAHNGTVATATNQKAGGVYIMRVTQPSSPKTLAWSTGYKWPGNNAPTMTSTASAVDILTFTSDGTYMYGAFSGSQNYT